jgi:hypothetical protein
LTYILNGMKTVEARLSVNQIAPYGKVHKGHIIWLKKSGGPIIAQCKAGKVWYYRILGDIVLFQIQEKFASRLCIKGSDFWELHRKANYATLIELEEVTPIAPFPFEKHDQRGWIVLKDSIKVKGE